MNWTVEKLKTETFVRVSIEGVFNPDDHLKMLKDIVSRRFWEPGTFILFDFRAVEFAGTDIEDIREAGSNRRRNDENIGSGKSAYLTKSLTDFARGRQFQLLTEDKVASELRIFMEEELAVSWLEDKNSSKDLP